MRRQIRQDILITKWHPRMNKVDPKRKENWKEGSAKISIWLLKQMKQYNLTQAEIARNKGISFGSIKHLLMYTKGRVQVRTVKKLCLALASAVPEKDYLEFLLEALEATNQSEAFPRDQILNLQKIILSKE